MTIGVPAGNLGLYYVNDFKISNNATTPNTKLDVTNGQARDSGNVGDILDTNSTTIDSSIVGVGGIDTGALAASTIYYIHAISSSYNTAPAGVILSASRTAPVLPFGYDSKKLVGIWLTDSSTHFVLGSQAGNGQSRKFYFNSKIAVLSAGTSQTLVTIGSLAAIIPPVDNIPVFLSVEFTPNVANDKVSFTSGGSVATLLPGVVGNVSAKISSGNLTVLSKLVTGAPTILYINSAATGATSAWVAGFEYFV